jgi:3-deoxy-D-arabino-heptulosonate 7-phosphate (DAHP) synthase
MKKPNTTHQNKLIIIAGPCAAESREQILAAIEQAKKRNVDFLRICLWKPRTKPGFEGLGEKGIELLVEAAKAGINPGAEVLIPEHAKLLMDKVLSEVPSTKLLLWIGARNQNHHIQREIARIASTDRRVFLMVKNQPWMSEDHWEGIVGHVLDGGISKDRLILCHRGFIPSGANPHNYRNIPEYSMAMRIKDKTGLPMIFDPSHTGGSVANVLKVTGEAKKYNFDGVIVEVHHSPKDALTDVKQQLTWEEFDRLASTITK